MKKTIRFLSLLLSLLLLCPLLPARAEKETGVIRVLLTRLKLTNKVEIALDGSYTLGNLSFQRGSHVTVSCATGSLILYYEGMALDAGKELVLTRHAVSDGKENGLRFNGAYELHPGDLHLTIQNGQLQAVLHAPAEEYLLGVVPYEMSDSFPLEALKAQAVAARTYALRKAGNSGSYDVVDNTNDQAYYGVKAELKNAARAVQETAGICGYYKGSLAECFYSASNGGQTELVSHVWGKGDYSYLTMADDPYDLENPDSVVRSAALPKEMASAAGLGALKDVVLGQLSEKLESMGYDGDMAHIQVTGIQGAETAVQMYPGTASRLMTKLRLHLTVQARRLLPAAEEDEVSMFVVQPTDAPGQTKQEQWSPMTELTEPVTVELDLFPTVESLLGLSINGGSNELMSIRETDDAFILESRRYGHGVGMSQRGAQCMAGEYKWNYEQILHFYYPGMTLQRMDYSFRLPAAVQDAFLATPGPAATPTPRPTPVALSATPGPAEYQVTVSNIGVTSYLNLRSEPNMQSSVLQQLYYGQALIVVQEEGDWLKVRLNDLTGYVMAQYVTRAGESPSPSPTPAR